MSCPTVEALFDKFYETEAELLGLACFKITGVCIGVKLPSNVTQAFTTL